MKKRTSCLSWFSLPSSQNSMCPSSILRWKNETVFKKKEGSLHLSHNQPETSWKPAARCSRCAHNTLLPVSRTRRTSLRKGWKGSWKQESRPHSPSWSKLTAPFWQTRPRKCWQGGRAMINGCTVFTIKPIADWSPFLQPHDRSQNDSRCWCYAWPQLIPNFAICSFQLRLYCTVFLNIKILPLV